MNVTILTSSSLKQYQKAMLEIAFHLSVNGQKSVRARVMGRSRPNFSPKLEPIHRTMLEIFSRLETKLNKMLPVNHISVLLIQQKYF